MKELFIVKQTVYESLRCDFCEEQILKKDGTPIAGKYYLKKGRTSKGEKEIIYCRKCGQSLGFCDQGSDEEYSDVPDGMQGELYEFKYNKAKEKLVRLSQELSSARSLIDGLITQVDMEKKSRIEREKRFEREIEEYRKMNRSLTRENNHLQREVAELEVKLNASRR